MGPVIEQTPTGYRYSMEPFLLADFIRPRAQDRVLEVGTGCGIIPLLLLTRQPEADITAVEIQSGLVRQARSNLKRNAAARVRLVHADFLKWARQAEAGTYDWLISNPPYRKARSGRINPDREKALARHEIALTLKDLVQTGVSRLNDGGRMALAYPADRLGEVRQTLEACGLSVSRLRRVYGHRASEHGFFLILGEKSHRTGAPEEDVFFIYQEDGAYTAAMQAIYASFDYSGRSHRVREK